MKKSVLIGNGQGFWGDSIDAPVDLVKEGPIDYLTLDYLAEVTMSIMQRQKMRNKDKGYATDFVHVIERILPDIMDRNIKVIANAGGVNPAACRDAIFDVAKKMGVEGLKVGIVVGDDILDRLQEFQEQGIELLNMDSGEPISTVSGKVISANVYMSSWPIVEALEQGAQIVILGRSTDTGLVMAPMAYEFGWKKDDYDKLAAGTIAGHIIECGAQCTGGNFTNWHEVPDIGKIGYPIIEAHPDGTFHVTKHEGTGGLVSVDTVSEQLVYEMGDPHAYITPDVVADFTSIRLEQSGPNRVKVFGIKGKPETNTYKVSASYLNGYKATGQLTVSGPDALKKAKLCADIVWQKLGKAGYDYDDKLVEFIGVNACHDGIAPEPEQVNEVVLRLGVRNSSRMHVERFGMKISSLVTSGPPGVTGFGGGRPKPQEIVAFWPALIPKSVIETKVIVEEV